jgi:hypothetical protein
MKRIFRTKKGKNADNFTLISNSLLNSNLSADSIYVMVQVLKKPDYWKFYLSKFSIEIKFGERRLRTAINELIEKGYCKKEKISKREVNYTFFEYSQLPNVQIQNESVSVANCTIDTDDLQY